MNRFRPKIFLSLPFLLIVLTFTNAQAFELSDNIAYPTLYEISLTPSVTITDDVELSKHDTFTVYLFDTLSISDNIFHDAHSAASTENFVPPNPMSKDVRDSIEATTSFFTHLGSFGV